MDTKIDYKKRDKQFYMPRTEPCVITVPPMVFIAVDGKGNPNTEQEYSDALELLYGLSYTIKMSKMGNDIPNGYFEYVVPPLEGLWWTDGEPFDGINVKDKNKFLWTSLIRQLEFVTEEIFKKAKETLVRKKGIPNIERARLITYEEGLCAHVMHIGSFDDEPETIQRLDSFIQNEGYITDITNERKHHEIYLSDPRKTQKEKLKTVIRHPIRKA